MNHHPDGSACKEGTRGTPPDFVSCCRIFEAHTSTCAYDLRYEWWPFQGFWVIAIAEDAGSGGVWIGHCPHCGKALVPASERPPDDEQDSGQPGRWIQI